MADWQDGWMEEPLVARVEQAAASCQFLIQKMVGGAVPGKQGLVSLLAPLHDELVVILVY